MTRSDIENLALKQLQLLDQAGLADPPSTRISGFSLKHAYGVAAQIVRLRRERGERTIGRKIGFTNQATWTQYGLNQPIWAYVYGDTVRFSQNGDISHPLKGTALPRIEPEIVFGLRAPAAGSDECSWLDSVDWLALGFELVDCHYPDWRFTPADGVVDFGLHATLIVGERIPVRDLVPVNLAEQLRTFRAKLLCDGRPQEEGSGSDVLGSPLRALDYLAREIGQQAAEPLAPGEVVTTGTLTAAPFVRPGQIWKAEVMGIDLPALTLELT